MNEINPEVVDRICPNASDSCVKKCPVFSMHLEAIEALDKTYKQVVEGATSEDVDNFAGEMFDQIPQFIRAQFGLETPEDMVTRHRKGSSMILEKIDELRESEAGTISEVSQGCDGPLELTGDDSCGRFVGVFVCRSAVAPEGRSLEAATVYRYPRQQ